MPPRLGTKIIAAGTCRPTSIASWPAPLGSRLALAPFGASSALDGIDEPGIELEWLERERRLQVELEALLGRDAGHSLLHDTLQLGEPARRRCAHVDREVCDAGNDVRASRLHRDLPHVGRHSLPAARLVAQREGDPGRAGEARRGADASASYRRGSPGRAAAHDSRAGRRST